jgi:alpha-beta hydrolase superfamily lysophospholipase
MNSSGFRLTSEDSREFQCYRWAPPSPRAIVQLVHGAAEHARRYQRFADALVARGFAVYAEDHRGHGQSVAPQGLKGDMGPSNAIERVVDDVACLSRTARAQHPELPLVLFGHSMGSLIAQRTLARHGQLYDAAVLCGSLAVDLLAQARPTIDAAVSAQGRDAPAEELQGAMFGALMQGFPDARTPFDWLSRDAEEVDRYIADPLCGFALTNGAWQDIAESGLRTLDPRELARIPRKLPVLIMSGSDDPVHLGGAAIQQLYDRLSSAGVIRLTTWLYPGGRHELLNETTREEVTRDVIDWIEGVLDGASA